jgi:peptidoglycan/xylan/chitin deacetylase (PgdA/CDA1 family)
MLASDRPGPPRPGRLAPEAARSLSPLVDRPPTNRELRGARGVIPELVEPTQPYVPLTGTTIRISFDRVVQRALLERSFRVEPEVKGRLEWLGERVLAYRPETSYAYDTAYRVQVAATGPDAETVGIWQWSFTTVKPITLTFDDCGTPTQLRSVLSILAQKGMKAIMFPIGWCARQYPWLVPQMLAEGHRVCNHTDTHPRLTYLSDAQIEKEIRGGVHTGCNLLRPPDGNWDGPDGRVARVAATLGYQIYMWDVDTYDYLGASAAAMLQAIRGRGGVILLHYHGRYTLDLLRQL